jgi:hypothetical protein
MNKRFLALVTLPHAGPGELRLNSGLPTPVSLRVASGSIGGTPSA